MRLTTEDLKGLQEVTWLLQSTFWVTWVWTTWVPLYTGIFSSEYYITTWLNLWMWRALYKLFRLTPLLYKGHLYMFGCRGFQAEGEQVQRPWRGVCLKVCGESKVKLQRSGLKFVCRAGVDIWDHSKTAACFLACRTSECHHLTYNAPCHLYTFPLSIKCYLPSPVLLLWISIAACNALILGSTFSSFLWACLPAPAHKVHLGFHHIPGVWPNTWRIISSQILSPKPMVTIVQGAVSFIIQFNTIVNCVELSYKSHWSKWLT